MESEFRGIKFGEKVKDVILDESERERLFEALRLYQSNQDLSGLVSELRKLLNEPGRLELYEHIRPLVQLSHQLEYSQKVPQAPGIKKRVIRLRRQPGESLGFALRGGHEHGIGVFVSKVQPGSQAAQKGLKVGDELIRVNGFSTTEATHEDVLNLIKSRNEVVLKVTHIGMLPLKDSGGEPLSWNYVDRIDSYLPTQEESMDSRNKTPQGRELKIFIDTSGVSSMGCGILSGPPYFPGIFVEKVRSGSLAAEAGLEVGDQIMEVNDQSFVGIKHKEAVVALKGSKQLHMVIKKKAGLPLFVNKEQGSLAPSESSTNSALIHEPPAGLPSSSPPTPSSYPTPSSPSTSSTQVSPGGRSVTTISVSYGGGGQSGRPDSSSATSDTSRFKALETQESLDESALIMQHLDKFGGSKRVERTRIEVSGDVEYSLPHKHRQRSPEPALPPPPPPLADMELDAPDNIDSLDMEPDESPRVEMIRKQPDVLGGKGAVLAARQATGRLGAPTLLGAGDSNLSSPTRGATSPGVPTDPRLLFTEEELDGRELIVVKVKGGQPLGLEVEGGIGTPLVDKVLVAEIFSGPLAKSGEVVKGDQLLMVNSRRMEGMTAAQVENVLKEVVSEPEVTLVLARGTFFNDEDAVTYF